MNGFTVEPPRNSVRRNSTIRIPKGLSTDLAYFLGFLLGDGSVGSPDRPTIYLVGHLADERVFYESFLSPLIRRLFGVLPYAYQRQGKQAYALHFKSKRLVKYLVEMFGFPIGASPKLVPNAIIMADMSARKAFLRGFFDADGSIVFSKKTYRMHSYPSIEIKSISRQLLTVVKQMLEEVGFTVSFGKSAESWIIRMNGIEMLESWMGKIGSKNIKHLSKYQVWKRIGFCPPGTTTQERLDMINCRRN